MSQDAAIDYRDIVRHLASQAVGQVRPLVEVGQVSRIDRDQRSCKVSLPGGASVTAFFGALQPRSVGQSVHVQHRNGRYWVVDVIGGTLLTGSPSEFLVPPDGISVSGIGLSLKLTWRSVDVADRYELQVSLDPAFTEGNVVGTFQTLSSAYTVQNLNRAITYYIRVRSVGGGDTVSEWSDPLSGTVPGLSDLLTDGFAPEDSPQPELTPGIGFLMAEWTAQPNGDLVTYEVHASTLSGFTPVNNTLLGETTGTHYAINHLADGSKLPSDSETFVRLVAKDGDGKAGPGAQGFGRPSKFGDVKFSDLGDGFVPSASPSSVRVTSGLGYLFVTWSGVANDDFTEYEVHLSKVDNFLPTRSTLVTVTPGLFFFAREEAPGDGSGPLSYDSTYYVRVWARDADGVAPTASQQVSATTQRTASTDLAEGAVGAIHIQELAVQRGMIADAAIGSAQIQDASITSAKVGAAAINAAHIQQASIETAMIKDASISTAKIGNAAITDAKVANLSADKINGGTITGINIVGSTIQTAQTGNRVIMQTGSRSGELWFHSGHPNELNAGLIRSGYDDIGPYLDLFGPRSVQGSEVPVILLSQNDQSGQSFINLFGDVSVNGWLYTQENVEMRGPLNMRDATMTIYRDNVPRVNFDAGTSWISYANDSTRLQMDGSGELFVVDNFNNNVRWTAGVNASDINMKREIQPARSGTSMETLSTFDVIDFEFKDDGMPEGRRRGLSAQSVQRHFPEGVIEAPNNLLLDTTSIVALTVGAVQDLNDRIKALENRKA